MEELKGRFLCEEIVTIIVQKYFERASMKVHGEPEFLDKINGVFICCMASAIRHCLKAWKTVECAKRAVDFKYDTAWCKSIPDP